MSEEHLEIMRPFGQQSKKCCGARIIRLTKLWCRCNAAFIVPYASIVELVETVITIP